jgi:nicotinate dehydrogenase subunit B
VIPPYAIPHRRIAVHDLAPIMRAAWMRGVSALPNTFAHECFIDELAAEAGEDPVAFRLTHVEDPRKADLIRRTAEAAGWREGTGPRLRREGRMAYGQGFAFATYVHGDFPGVAAATAAWICEVAVDVETGEISLTRVFVGQDQGLVINPDGVRQQIHGNVHQTAGRVLSEEVTFDEIAPTQVSWSDYPILRFPEAPEVGTLLMERPGDPPLGVGESAAVPAAAAIANAVFDATGVRMRAPPFTPEKMRAALAEAGYGVTAEVAAPRRAGWRRALRGAGLALAGALTFGAVSLPVHRAIPPVTGGVSHAPEMLERGRLLFLAGNCAECHTGPSGVANAGGRPIETPFGTVWSTNLTPDPETGLGRWSFAAFERAMRHGISRDGTNLYPAFPYTSFAGMSEGDLMALYAYVQSLEPVVAEVPRAEMLGPVALRPGVAFWNALHHDAAPLEDDPGRDAVWNRGRYLVETVGHCSACHSPRGVLGAELGGPRHLAGAMVEGWWAPALAGPEAAARGWDEDRLRAYLRTGHAAGLASAGGPMAAVAGTLAQLPEEDLGAMAVYLASLIPEGAAAAPVAQAAMPPTAVHRIFEASCAICHEPAFEGMLTAARVPLGMTTSVRAPDARSVEAVIRDGLRAPAGTDLRDMPGFGRDLSEAQIAELARYVRARYAPDLAPWVVE